MDLLNFIMIFASCFTSTNIYIYGVFTTEYEFIKNLKLLRKEYDNDFSIDKIKTIKIQMDKKFKIHDRYLMVAECLDDINAYIVIVLDKWNDFGDEEEYKCTELKLNNFVLVDEDSLIDFEDIYYVIFGHLPEYSDDSNSI